ncbi:DUF6705 family protein [Mucilaginibacter sp. McL0603]|uniref:DUF6705 family protein n=1 Tax=Mucilaginibacter sp. McL0603 TaxID=3415670 RepID=UPI003CF7A825
MKILKIVLLLIIGFRGVVMAQQNNQSGLKEYDISNPDKKFTDYSNTHMTDKNADKYIGTWKWKIGTNEFTLKLEKGQKNMGTKEKPWLMDILKGGFQSIKNGKESINNLSVEPLIGGTEGNPDKIILYYSDSQQHKLLIFEATLTANNTLRWTLSKRPQEWQAPISSVPVPVDIELNRIQ